MPTGKDTPGADERRSRRAAAQQVFDELAKAYMGSLDASRGEMFGSLGLLRNDKFFAFVGRAGDLVVKLPETRAAALVASGEASAVKAGRNPTREWVSVPRDADGDTSRWRQLIAHAYQYAGGAKTR
jgi:TfoX/Sxy family transcriptional regulator of competence genes